MKKIALQIFSCIILLVEETNAQTASWLWAKNLPFDKTTNQKFIKSTIDSRGNTYMITFSNGGNLVYPNGTISASSVYILSKINGKGIILWGKQLPFLGDYNDLINTLEANNKGEIYFTYLSRKSCFGIAPDKCVTTMGSYIVKSGTSLVKADTNGNIKYVKPLVQRTVGSYAAYVQQLVLKGDTQLVVVGNGETVNTTNGVKVAGKEPLGNPSNHFIALVDSAGNGISGKYITTNNVDIPNSINSAVVDSLGNLYLVGRINREGIFNGQLSVENYPFTAKKDYWAFVAKVTTSYQFEWLKYLRGTKVNSELRTFNINKVVIDNKKGNLYFIGNALDSAIYNNIPILATSGKALDGFIVAVNMSDGDTKWSKLFSNTFTEDLADVKVDLNGNLIVLQNDEYSRNFINKYTSDGNLIGSIAAGTGAGSSIHTFFDDKILYSGSFIKTTTIGTFQLGGNTNPNVTIPMLAMCQIQSSIITEIQSNSFEQTQTFVYPNPTKDQLFINSKSTINSFVIYNSQGLEVSKSKTVENSIDVSDLNAGIYILEFFEGDKVYKTKFIKQ